MNPGEKNADNVAEMDDETLGEEWATLLRTGKRMGMSAADVAKATEYSAAVYAEFNKRRQSEDG
jgi:hypothetical protein